MASDDDLVAEGFDQPPIISWHQGRSAPARVTYAKPHGRNPNSHEMQQVDCSGHSSHWSAQERCFWSAAYALCSPFNDQIFRRGRAVGIGPPAEQALWATGSGTLAPRIAAKTRRLRLVSGTLPMKAHSTTLNLVSRDMTSNDGIPNTRHCHNAYDKSNKGRFTCRISK